MREEVEETTNAEVAERVLTAAEGEERTRLEREEDGTESSVSESKRSESD